MDFANFLASASVRMVVLVVLVEWSVLEWFWRLSIEDEEEAPGRKRELACCGRAAGCATTCGRVYS